MQHGNVLNYLQIFLWHVNCLRTSSILFGGGEMKSFKCRVAAGLSLAVILTITVTGPAAAMPILYGLVNFAGTGGGGGGGGGSGGDSDAELVIINQTDGSITSVGSTGFKRASGLATNPLTGQLFATGIKLGPTGLADTSVLFTVNPLTGVGTEVGETGIENSPIDEFNVAGLAFRGDGTLFGYFEPGDTPGTIDTGTGVATGLTAFGSGVECCGNGITFVNDDLLHANDLGELDQVTGVQSPIIALDYTSPFFDQFRQKLGELDQVTGVQSPIIALDYTSPFFDINSAEARVAAMDVHPLTGDIYASIIIEDIAAPTAFLAILDPSTGTFTYLGPSNAKVDAVAFALVETSEPGALVLLGLGLAGLGFRHRRS